MKKANKNDLIDLIDQYKGLVILQHELKMRLDEVEDKLYPITKELYMLPNDEIAKLRMWNYEQYRQFKRNRR